MDSVASGGGPAPAASVVIPAYDSHATVAATLGPLLDQARAIGAEVIVVDSSPGPETANVVERFSEVRLERSEQRLLPHAARNRGVELARGQILVFTDPDCIPAEGWLRQMIEAAGGSADPGGEGPVPKASGAIIGGAVEPTDDSLLDRAIHITKFWPWLGGGRPGGRDHLPTASLAITRETWDQVGPFGRDFWSADTLLCLKAGDAGVPPTFLPEAVVTHEHEAGLRDFLKERRARGKDFAQMRAKRGDWSRLRAAVHALGAPLVSSVLIARSLNASRQAGRIGWALPTIPLQLAGFTAWAVGEAQAHAGRALQPTSIADLAHWRRDPLGLLDRCEHAAAPGSAPARLNIVRPTHVLRDPEDVRHVLIEAPDRYPKSKRVRNAHATRVTGRGAINAASPAEEHHRHSRELIDPLIGSTVQADLAPRILAAADETINGWSAGASIDLAAEATAISQAALLSTLFGIDPDRGNKAIVEGIEARREIFLRSIKAIAPRPGFLPSTLSQKARRRLAEYDREVDRLLAEARATSPASATTVAAALADVDPSEAREQITSLLTVGFHTVAMAVTWTLYELLRHPGELEKVTAEALTVGATGGASLETLPATLAAVEEALRLHPPSWVFARVAGEDDVLPSGGEVRAGEKVFISPWLIQRSERYWADPTRFDTARFVKGAAADRPRWAYLPFGGGRRICTGRAFARTEAVLVVARILGRTELAAAGGRIEHSPQLSLEPAGPIMVDVKELL